LEREDHRGGSHLDLFDNLLISFHNDDHPIAQLEMRIEAGKKMLRGRERERQRERDSQRDREGETERVREIQRDSENKLSQGEEVCPETDLRRLFQRFLQIKYFESGPRRLDLDIQDQIFLLKLKVLNSWR
jgi:hypothetical protein